MRIINRKIWLCAAMLALASCTFAQNPVPPVTPDPKQPPTAPNPRPLQPQPAPTSPPNDPAPVRVPSPVNAPADSVFKRIDPDDREFRLQQRDSVNPIRRDSTFRN